MRAHVIAGLGLVGLAGAAAAQDRVVVPGPGARYPVPAATVPARPMPVPTVAPQPLRPLPLPPATGLRRGMTLPAAYRGPQNYVPDWASYGLPQPPVGYDWYRYGGQAVLIDARGEVYDAEYPVNWDDPQVDDIYATVPDYPPPPPGYGAPYGDYPAPVVQTYSVPAGGTQTVFVGPGVTTVTVTTQPATTTTTTTTEYYDDAVTYTRPAPRVTERVYRSKLKRR